MAGQAQALPVPATKRREGAKLMKELLAILQFVMLSALANAQFITGVTFTTTATSVTIMWSSGVPTAGYVRFGTTRRCSSRTPGLTPMGTSASLTIDNLPTGVNHYFKIVAMDSLNQVAKSLLYTAMPVGEARDVSLTWNPNAPEQNVVGYNMYRSQTSGYGYALLNSIIPCDPNAAECAYDDHTARGGLTYCYVNTAVD